MNPSRDVRKSGRPSGRPAHRSNSTARRPRTSADREASAAARERLAARTAERSKAKTPAPASDARKSGATARRARTTSQRTHAAQSVSRAARDKNARTASRTASRPGIVSAQGGARRQASRMVPALPQQRRRRRVPIVAAALVFLVLVAVAGWGADHLMNGSRIYQGISIGTVDVSGMTREEAAEALDEAYSDHVASGLGIVFASDDAAQEVDVDTALTEEAAQAEQLSVEEARADKKLWVAEAGVLGAHVPTADLAEEAFAVGRDGGLPQRIQAATESVNIPVRLDFDEDALEALASEIDETIGEPRIDSNVKVEDGIASVVEGHDGTIVDRDEFRAKIAEGFLGPDPDDFSFVAHTSFAASRIDAAAAETCRAFVQQMLDQGISFTFEGDQWDLDGTAIGSWVTTSVVEDDNGARLIPSFDEATACADLLDLIRQAGFVSAVTVSFREEGGEIWVYAQDGSRYPLTAAAVAEADAAVFAPFRDSDNAPEGTERPTVAIGWGAAPAKSSFDDALTMGLISEVSTYTTEYNDGAGTANRRHNIHLAADLLNDSITSANGGIWSFTETLGGQANEDMGFKGAHVISNGEYTDAIGGGICQVATTVFNAVYEGGYPVTERRNHSLYISSYPTGRDAAIAYPYLDLKWENDTTSDILLRTRYTDSTLTVTLYGIDPGYVVSSETSDWRPGDAYQTKYKVDENEPEGTRYVKTKGADGRSITVHRTVRDRSGTVLHEEDFESNYNPINEVIVVGPNTPTNEDDDQEKDSDDKEDARVSTGD